PAVADVLALARGVEPQSRLELLVICAAPRVARLAAGAPGHAEHAARAEPERLAALAGQVLEREDPHHQEVRAVDPLVALRDHGLHAEQFRPLRRPVARGPGAVLLAG